ncbi:MAG: hypothetical protein Q9208_001721 [Pyrenodesmia sp. 3 TL-2023]
MAIVMLGSFDPKDLGLPSWAVFAPRDVASFGNVGTLALRVANECLSEFAQSNETGDAASTLGFTSAMGYGTTVNLAKIEGGPAYQQMMRTAARSDEALVRDPTLMHQPDRLIQLPLALQSFSNLLPHWFGLNDVGTLALSEMLQSLKIASESYLEAPLAGVEVVVPFSASDAFLRRLRSTSSSLGIYLPESAHPPAGILAACAYGLGEYCADDVVAPAGKVILTVDYSRAALTALLADEDCGILEIEEELHDTTLGADALSTSPVQVRAGLVRAFRKLTSRRSHRMEISELVLIGESAGDKQLQDVLKEVLKERFDMLLKGANERRTGVLDPLFVASRVVAYTCWAHMDISPEDEKFRQLGLGS